MDEPCDLDVHVAAAYEALVAGELDGAGAHLLRAEQDLGCGAIASREGLGRFWLVEGALLARTGDPEASLSLSAARRTAPELWLDGLGEDVHGQWLAAAPEPGRGALAFDVDVGALAVAVDGAPFGGGPLPAGLHAVQVSDPDGAVRYGAMLYVGASTVTNVTTGLPPPAPTPPAPEATSAPVTLSIRAVTGMSLAAGRALEAPDRGGTLTEPAAKLVLPIGLGAGARIGRGWARAELGLGWLVGGPYLSVLADGSPHRTPLRADIGASGGVTVDLGRPGLGPLEVGGASGVQWPGRLSQRALVAVNAPGGAGLQWVAEVRAGFNIPTDRPVEPAAEVLFGLLLGL